MLHVTSIHDARCNDAARLPLSPYMMLPLSRYMRLDATSASGHFTLFIFRFLRLKMGHK
jgi:hypothetical protein